ncbi:hypothetical protein [Streptococcus suis]|nr:hypothetical protein [Streptococcus suis]
MLLYITMPTLVGNRERRQLLFFVTIITLSQFRAFHARHFL